MKKITCWIILIWVSLYWINNSFAETDLKATTTLKWYELYKDRVSNFCDKFKNPESPNQSVELIYTINENYPDLWDKNNEKYIDEAVEKYKNFMDSIYTCATSVTTKRQFSLIKDELINQSPKLKTNLDKELTSKIENLDKKIENLDWKCKINEETNNNQIKKAVLNQTTYELCRYVYYLEYLNEQSSESLNLEENTPLIDVPNDVFIKQNKITNEIENAYATTSLTFQAYSDYEDNVWTHILLQLIKEDFSEYRVQLHKVLTPINQVIYKISNAMKY